MSQVIIQDGTKRGIEIQRHLDEIYENTILKTFGKRIIETEDSGSTDCQACGHHETRIVWSEKYSGERGFCVACKHNWPES